MREHRDRSSGWLGALAPWQRSREDQGRVTGLLAELEPEGFRSQHGVDTGFGDIDHVVVGPTGVLRRCWYRSTAAWRATASSSPI
jgi:hypothetical protein